jgi:pimeloyl-ACP methyl ester carboxylesterase
MTTYREITVDGHTLAVLKRNEKTEGVPIVLLHGITHSVQAWSTDEVFGEYGPCYALSLPAHYPAVAPPEFFQTPLTARKMVAPLAGAIRQIADGQPVRLVGHSTGGFSALALAALYPELVREVISLAGFARGRWIKLYGFYQDMARSPFGFLLPALAKLTLSQRALFKFAFLPGVVSYRTLKTYLPFETLVDNMYSNGQKLDMQAIRYFFREFPDVDITPLLAQIHAPALVMTGDKDALVSPTQASHIARYLPHAQLVVIKNAGHMLYMDQPAEYSRVLRAWLSRPSPTLSSPALSPR